MLRYQAGKSVRFPYEVNVHIVAARYGQDPDDVERWPADKFLTAVRLLGVTGGR